MPRDKATLLDIHNTGMRDQLIHAYDAVDIEEVWSTVKKDIPDLLRKIDPLLQEIS